MTIPYGKYTLDAVVVQFSFNGELMRVKVVTKKTDSAGVLALPEMGN